MPAAWVTDEAKWDKAKSIVKKQYGLSEKEDRFWKVVTGVYRQMKGDVAHKGLMPDALKKAIDDAMIEEKPQKKVKIDQAAIKDLADKLGLPEKREDPINFVPSGVRSKAQDDKCPSKR